MGISFILEEKNQVCGFFFFLQRMFKRFFLVKLNF